MDKPREQENPEMKTMVERREFLGGAATLAGTSLLGLGLPGNADAVETAQDRMPPIPPEKLTDVQKKAMEEVIAGPRGSFVGPFVPLLRSPDLMSRLQKVGEYLRYNTKLGPNISEFTILIAARQWTQQFEWDTHDKLALKAGVKPEILAAVAEGRRPAGMTDDEEMTYDFCMELHHNRCVSDASYGRVAKRFGEQGVIDMIGLCGYYTLLGMVMNVARTPLPAGKSAPLAEFPR